MLSSRITNPGSKRATHHAAGSWEPREPPGPVRRGENTVGATLSLPVYSKSKRPVPPTVGAPLFREKEGYHLDIRPWHAQSRRDTHNKGLLGQCTCAGFKAADPGGSEARGHGPAAQAAGYSVDQGPLLRPQRSASPGPSALRPSGAHSSACPLPGLLVPWCVLW